MAEVAIATVLPLKPLLTPTHKLVWHILDIQTFPISSTRVIGTWVKVNFTLIPLISFWAFTCIMLIAIKLGVRLTASTIRAGHYAAYV